MFVVVFTVAATSVKLHVVIFSHFHNFSVVSSFIVWAIAV